MAINKKLIFWNNSSFNPPTSSTDTDPAKDVLWSSIVFFGSNSSYPGKIWTHGSYYPNFTSDLLTNFVTGDNVPITASDSILSAFGKVQGQLDAKAPSTAGLYYVIGNTSGTDGTWTGNIPGITSLYAGLTISYYIGIAGASTTTLDINGLGAKTVLRDTSNLTTHLPIGTVVLLTYDGTYWKWADYDADTFDRTYWNNTITAGNIIYSYKLLMQGLDGKFYPLTLESGTGTTKTVSAQEFIINSPILFYYSTTTVALNAQTTNVYSEIQLTTLNYTANQASWTSQQNIYLKGTILANGNFKLDNTSPTSFLTQTLPTVEDGFVYILLGYMYGTTAMRLFQYHPMYEFKDGSLKLYRTRHLHGNINDDGTIGSTSGLVVVTGTNGLVTASNKLTILDNGNVGIGTNNPFGRLDISSTSTASQNLFITKLNSGTANQSNGALYFDNYHAANTARNSGVEAGSLYFRFSQPTSGGIQNGAKISAISDGTQSGVITPTALAFSVSSGSSLSEALRINNIGNVGIGTTTPIEKFTVYDGRIRNGLSSISNTSDQWIDTWVTNNSGTPIWNWGRGNGGDLTINGPGLISFANSTVNFNVKLKVGGSDPSIVTNGVGYLRLASGGANPIKFDTNGATKVVIDSSGNLGIGTTNPGAKLNVVGDLYADADGTNDTAIRIREGGSNNYGAFFKYGANDQLSIGTRNGTTTDTVAIQIDRGSQNIIFNGNIGIGTTTPRTKLDVAGGNININNTNNANKYGIITKNGIIFIHDFNYGNNGTVSIVGNNTFVGLNAGNLTMGSTATASYHASYNTGIGVSALQNNTTGYYNSTLGVSTLQNNTTGSYNSTLGVSALQNNTTGSNNSALGYSAGRFIADGSTSNQTSNNSLYLGYNAMALANGDTNEIVIGYNTTGIGSNSVVLGNDAITTTALKGNVGIGTSAPVYKLDVNGLAKFYTGIMFPSLYGADANNGFFPGTNDGATYTNYNTVWKGHWGVALYNPTGGGTYKNQVSGLIDFREGIIDMKGGFKANSGAIRIGGTNSYFNSGNVGIGTTNPGYKLDVNGNGHFAGPVDVDGVLQLSNSGLKFADNAFGGSGDIAKMYLATKGGEATTMTFEVGNEGDDTINFITPSSIGLTHNSNIILDSLNYSNYAATKDYVTTAVNNIQIGGRNLVVGTSTPTTITASHSDYFNYYYSFFHLEANKDYVFSCEVDCPTWGGDNSTDTVEAWLRKDWSSYFIHINLSTSTLLSTGLYYNTYVFQTAQSGNYIIRLDVNYAGATHTFSKVMVAEGNKATTWTPAPEDLDASISSAITTVETDTASKYLKLTGGTVAGNLTVNSGVITGSLTGNADTATRLQTPRTIWGQSFDGTGNVDGTLNIRNAGTGHYDEGIRIHKSSNNCNTIVLCGAENTGDSGTSVNSWSILNDNNNCFLITRNSANAINGLLINQSGNVGIGKLDASYKLDVAGGARFTSDILGTMFKSSYGTATYLNGNQGNALVSSTATAGGYVALLRYPTTNGVVTINGYQDNLLVGYTSNTTINASTNALDKQLVLINESGNSIFPGTITSTSFINSTSNNNYILLGGGGTKLLSDVVVSYVTSTSTTGTTNVVTTNTNTYLNLLQGNLVVTSEQIKGTGGILVSSDINGTISIDGASFVDTTNNQTIAGTKTFSSTISGSINGSSNSVALHSGNEINIGGSYTGNALYINYNDGGTFSNYSFYGGNTSLANIIANGATFSSSVSSAATISANRLTSTDIAIGLSTPSTKLHVYQATALGSTVNNNSWITTITGNCGGNTMQKNLWLLRDAAGSDWTTTRLHDAISVDSSFLTPGTDTKVWWERDPSNNIQSWGNASSTYLTINSGSVGIGNTGPSYTLDVTGDGRFTSNLTALSFIGNASTSTKASQTIIGSCNTAQATAAKIVDLQNFVLDTGAKAIIRFNFGSVANATININNTGAKTLYYNGLVVDANTWSTGDIVEVQYDGAYYHILFINKDLAVNKPMFGGDNSGNAATATTLQTARTISLGTGVTSTATLFNGSTNITIPVTGVSESYLTWGGKNFTNGYGPIDAVMNPLLGANRFAFMPPAGIVIEYSRDGGTTWVDYGATDSTKINLFNGNSGPVQIGGGGYAAGTNYINYQLRITINTSAANVYTELNKFIMYVSTNGSSGSWCSIDARLQSNYTGNIDTWVNFANQVSIAGWSGYNVLNTTKFTTYGNTPTSQYGQIRFTFGNTGYSTGSTGLTIYKIMGFGGYGWTTPSSMASWGQMYTYDYLKNVTFPSYVTAGSFYASSDESLKTKITPITSSDIPIKLYQFNWKKDGLKSYGFIAQDLEKTNPELVSLNEETNLKSVNYEAALSLMLATVENRVTSVEYDISEFNSLRQEVNELRNLVKKLLK